MTTVVIYYYAANDHFGQDSFKNKALLYK